MRQKQTAKALPTKSKRPAAQIGLAKKAAEVKAENAAKRAQPRWLRQPMPVLASETLPAPERVNAANQSQGPPRLLDKAQVCAIVNVTFPTIWSMMRKGTFPRSRVCGGKSMWLSSEVEAWMAALPLRPLKGDAPLEVAE